MNALRNPSLRRGVPVTLDLTTQGIRASARRSLRFHDNFVTFAERRRTRIGDAMKYSFADADGAA